MRFVCERLRRRGGVVLSTVADNQANRNIDSDGTRTNNRDCNLSNHCSYRFQVYWNIPPPFVQFIFKIWRSSLAHQLPQEAGMAIALPSRKKRTEKQTELKWPWLTEKYYTCAEWTSLLCLTEEGSSSLSRQGAAVFPLASAVSLSTVLVPKVWEHSPAQSKRLA